MPRNDHNFFGQYAYNEGGGNYWPPNQQESHSYQSNDVSSVDSYDLEQSQPQSQHSTNFRHVAMHPTSAQPGTPAQGQARPQSMQGRQVQQAQPNFYAQLSGPQTYPQHDAAVGQQQQDPAPRDQQSQHRNEALRYMPTRLDTKSNLRLIGQAAMGSKMRSSLATPPPSSGQQNISTRTGYPNLPDSHSHSLQASFDLRQAQESAALHGDLISTRDGPHTPGNPQLRYRQQQQQQEVLFRAAGDLSRSSKSIPAPDNDGRNSALRLTYHQPGKISPHDNRIHYSNKLPQQQQQQELKETTPLESPSFVLERPSFSPSAQPPITQSPDFASYEPWSDQFEEQTEGRYADAYVSPNPINARAGCHSAPELALLAPLTVGPRVETDDQLVGYGPYSTSYRGFSPGAAMTRGAPNRGDKMITENSRQVHHQDYSRKHNSHRLASFYPISNSKLEDKDGNDPNSSGSSYSVQRSDEAPSRYVSGKQRSSGGFSDTYDSAGRYYGAYEYPTQPFHRQAEQDRVSSPSSTNSQQISSRYSAGPGYVGGPPSVEFAGSPYPLTVAHRHSGSPYAFKQLLAVSDPTGQKAPPGAAPQIFEIQWHEQKILCYQVVVNGVYVARREDTDMINGTKLLNVAGMSRGRRDRLLKAGALKRDVVKSGPMHFKGIWIPLKNALALANRERITDLLYPLFVDNLKQLLEEKPELIC